MVIDLDGTEQPIDPKLVLAIEFAFRSVSTTSVEFVPAPRAWQESNPRGSVSGPKGPRKAQIKIELAKRDGFQCAYCDREFVDLDDATLDHVIPNSIVRHWQEWNLLLACEACNNLKDDRLPAILMPLLCHVLRELVPVAQYKRQARREQSNRQATARRRQKALAKAQQTAAQHHARVNQQLEALSGTPVRPALEAPKPRPALLPGSGA